MYVLQMGLPDGRQQTAYQAYTAPVTNLWLARTSGHKEPDIILMQSLKGKLIKLVFYQWQGERYRQSWLASPSEEQLAGYAGEDKVYVRLNKLVRQLRIKTKEGLIWRRLTYDFKAKAWVTEG